jgi:hypothetical protein
MKQFVTTQLSKDKLEGEEVGKLLIERKFWKSRFSRRPKLKASLKSHGVLKTLKKSFFYFDFFKMLTNLTQFFFMPACCDSFWQANFLVQCFFYTKQFIIFSIRLQSKICWMALKIVEIERIKNSSRLRHFINLDKNRKFRLQSQMKFYLIFDKL